MAMFVFIHCHAQLSNEQKLQLIELVKNDYSITQMEGCTSFKLSRKVNVLVVNTLVDVSDDLSDQNRDAKRKAMAMVTEFIQGVSSKSESEFEEQKSSSKERSTNKSRNSGSVGSLVEDEITNDISARTASDESKKFTLTEKQLSKNKRAGQGLQKLAAFNGPNGEKVFSYYVILK